MKQLFLVRGLVRKNRYMSSEEDFDDDRIVWAADERDAEQLYEQFWESQNEAYSVSFHIIRTQITVAIGQPD